MPNLHHSYKQLEKEYESIRGQFKQQDELANRRKQALEQQIKRYETLASRHLELQLAHTDLQEQHLSLQAANLELRAQLIDGVATEASHPRKELRSLQTSLTIIRNQLSCMADTIEALNDSTD